MIYPKYFNKNLDTKFLDRYDDKVHSHVLLQDVDHHSVERLGVQFFKSICDEAGYPIDQKYKTPQLTRATILVTSNFTINEIVPEGKGVDQTKMALHRRFLQLRIDTLQQYLGIKLINEYDRKRLKSQGNNDPAGVS